MKRTLLKLIITCTVLACVLSVMTFAYTNEPENASDEVINVVRLLEIANGDQNGNMNFDKEVTRAEFLKMAISASTSKETAANTKLNISLFPDVKNSFWGAGYISVAINNGLVTGYIDGTFKPNNPVTLEEAATIILRLLGYTNNDLIGSYPSAQLQKYEDLELDEGIFAQRGDKLSREECMILIYNALSAKTKQGTVYCTALGLSTNNEGKLDYSKLLEDKLDGPILVTDTNAVFFGTDFTENENTTYLLNNVEIASSDIREKDVVYYSEIINTVYIYRKTATGILDSASSTSVTISGKSYNIASASAKDKLSFGGKYNEEKAFITLILGINDGVIDVETGSIDKISENDNNSTLLSMIDKTISKAVFIKTDNDAVNWTEKIPFETSSAEIFLNGSISVTPTVSVNDVIYYSKAFNKIWIFRKTVSGNIEQINSVTSPTSVTVSGKSYQIASSEAAYDLSVYGAYEIGDKVTLILGINDECVAIKDTSSASGIIYGVVTAKGEKTYIDKDGEEYTADYVTVTDTTGTVFTYEFKNDHFNIGSAVKVAFADTVTITRIPYGFGKSIAAQLSQAIKNGSFAENCEIIDVNGSNTMKVSASRLSGAVIEPEYFIMTECVLYYEFDEDYNIKRLILKNFTGDLDEYGIVIETSKGVINYMIDKNKKTLSGQTTTCSVGAARFRNDSGTISTASALTGKLENIDAVTSTAVYDANGNEYLCADNLKVFIKDEGIYFYSSVSEISNGEYEMTAYYDRSPLAGGRIRVIVAMRKI